MSTSWWNGRQITASGMNRQKMEDVPLKDKSAGNEKQLSRFQTFRTTEYITCM
jgi:hypothetical protein